MEAKTTTKTISNGTLGLRFMQNALRAKQMKEVEADRAPVKDDGEWEIDSKVRDSWNVGTSASSSQTVSYESSYLPFLFSSEASTSTSTSSLGADRSIAKGRRVFNKHGVEEVAREMKPEESTSTSTLAPPHQDPSKRYKVHPRPKSISGGPGGLFGFPDAQPPKAQTKSKGKEKDKDKKTAKETIYDNTGVGEDLHPSKIKQPVLPPPVAAKPVFLKPAGVDDPQEAKPKPKSSPAPVASAGIDGDIIHGARSKKLKRERPGLGPETDTPGLGPGPGATAEDSTRKKKKKKRNSGQA